MAIIIISIHFSAIPKDKVCESSPIELNIVAYGQWNLGKPAGRDRLEVSPPLDRSNPLLISKEMLGSQEVSYSSLITSIMVFLFLEFLVR